MIGSDTGIVIRREGAAFYTNTQVFHNTVFQIRGISGNANNAALSVSDCTAQDTKSFIIQNNVFSVGT